MGLDMKLVPASDHMTDLCETNRTVPDIHYYLAMGLHCLRFVLVHFQIDLDRIDVDNSLFTNLKLKNTFLEVYLSKS